MYTLKYKELCYYKNYYYKEHSENYNNTKLLEFYINTLTNKVNQGVAKDVQILQHGVVVEYKYDDYFGYTITITKEGKILRCKGNDKISSRDKKMLYSIISVSFGKTEKTYDYLLTNKSGQQIVKDQKVNIITGGNSSQRIQIKHLIKFEKVPSHVTKTLIITSPTTGLVGYIKKGE